MEIIKTLKEDIYKIKNSDNAYISKSGNIYIKYKDGYFIKKQYKTHGYKYVKILYQGEMRSKRVHRLMAETFLENPNNYNIVGHKNNIKDDNSLENLYWTSISENTQKAFDDGLAVNAKGYEDSQSIPIYVCDDKWNIIDEFGSIGECAKVYKISKSTISKQILLPPENRHITKLQLYFIKQSDYCNVEPVKKVGKPITAKNIKTGEITNYSSITECAKELGISKPTILRHLRTYVPKNRCGYKFYFSNDYRKA